MRTKIDWFGLLILLQPSFSSPFWHHNSANCEAAIWHLPPISVLMIHRKRLSGPAWIWNSWHFAYFSGNEKMLSCSVSPWYFRSSLAKVWALDCLPVKNTLKTWLRPSATQPVFSQLTRSSRTCSASFHISVLWINKCIGKHKSIP